MILYYKITVDLKLMKGLLRWQQKGKTMAYDYDGGKHKRETTTNTHYEGGRKVAGRLTSNTGTKLSTNSFEAHTAYKEVRKTGKYGEREVVKRTNDSPTSFVRQDALVYDGGKKSIRTGSGKNQEIHSHAIADVTHRYEYYHGPNSEIAKSDWDMLSKSEKDELTGFKEHSFYTPYKENAKDSREAERIAEELDARAYGGRGYLECHDCNNCSWWYHQRCLQGNSSGRGCLDYTTEQHTCSTCSNFDSTPGGTRNGDSWYGICNAYGGNPIRHSPYSHTCKAWS